MGDELRVSRWGSGLAVRIPEAVAEQWGVQEGSPIEIVPERGHVVLRKRAFDLPSMLREMTPENNHPEEDFGPATGQEAW